MKTKKILALIIALTMCISVFPTRIFAVNYNGVEFTALEGTGNDGEDQNYTKLLDGKKTSSNFTKWCDKIGLINGAEYIPYIIFKASQKVIITDYTFITGNDNQKYPGRNPKDWVLYGCNDYDEASKTGGTWTAIHTVTDDAVMQDENYTPFTFKIEKNNEMYQYYKLVITANHGAQYDLIQLSEMELNWTVAYYVTFDKNGGNTEASPQIIQAEYGLPTTNPTKTDHRFLGWYTKDGTDGDWGEEFTAETTVNEDITVYAKWEKLYSVTFDLNGGTADSAINPIYHGDPLPTVIPTKDNVKFGGWFTKNGAENGGDWGEQYSLDTAVTNDITVYAKWNTVNITFDKNGGDTDANPSVISSGEPLPTINPTRNGYKFVGWYTTNGDDGVELIPFTQEMSDAATEDMTVYAEWEITTITFDNNNGEVEEKPNQLFYGEIPETNPTMTGFTFDGWYTKNGMETGDWGEKYLDGAIISEDTTVYAKWKATDKDCIADVTLTALSGTAGNNGESYDKLVDGKKIAGNFSKWCVNSSSAEVILKASAYTIPVGYTLTTGNDNTSWQGRNPKDWVLYGCNDYDENKKTGTWTELDNITNDNVLKDMNYKSYDFTIGNTKAYKYFKFNILSVQSGNTMQLAEFELKGEGCEHTFGALEKNAPTCTVPGKTVYICSKCDISVTNTVEATGHTLGDNGTCSVCGERCGAAVGEVYYDNLQSAIDAALTSSSNKTVTLFQDFDITETITIGSGKVTLDLNGHTINMTGSGSVIKLTNSASEFILNDSSTEKTGTITNSSTDTEYGSGIYIYDGNMTMNGGTIKACTAKYGGGIYKRSGELKIAGGIITECKADGNFRSRGGGIFNNNGKLEIAGGTISKCSANGWDSSYQDYVGGGGIYNYSGNLVMSGGTITECTASGGIYSTGGGIRSISLYAVVEMNGGTISNCIAKSGGGIYSLDSKIIIKGGTITDCYARSGSGGGILAGRNLTLTEGTITKNSSNEEGGGIYIGSYATADISGGIISDNSATTNGGGIYNYGTLNITGGEIKNNTTSQNGGGIYAEPSSGTNKGIVTMSGGTIFGNKASKEGGGIYVDNGGTLTMTGGTVESNTASTYDGGGIMFYNNSTGTISNALIKGNKASNFGGGIQVENSSNVTIENTEITENTTYGGGGVSAQYNSTVTVNGGKIFKNNSNQGCGLRIDEAVAHLNGGVEISENGSADGMYNNYSIYGAGIWASEATIYFNDANVINNYSQKGGGVYTYDDAVYLNLYKGNITGNIATVEAGGICCKTNEITIKGGIQITGNKLASEIENNVYLRNNTTLKVENPYTEAEDGVIRANIGVAIEGESSNIVAANETDYSGCFMADLPEEEVYYDASDNIVKLDGTYTITFDYGDGAYYGTAKRGGTVAETEKIPTREGYYFGGWYIGDTAYGCCDERYRTLWGYKPL